MSWHRPLLVQLVTLSQVSSQLAPVIPETHSSHCIPAKELPHTQPPLPSHRELPGQVSVEQPMSHCCPNIADDKEILWLSVDPMAFSHCPFPSHPGDVMLPCSAPTSSLEPAAEQRSHVSPAHPSRHSQLPDDEHLPLPSHSSDAVHHSSQSSPWCPASHCSHISPAKALKHWQLPLDRQRPFEEHAQVPSQSSPTSPSAHSRQRSPAN